MVKVLKERKTVKLLNETPVYLIDVMCKLYGDCISINNGKITSYIQVIHG